MKLFRAILDLLLLAAAIVREVKNLRREQEKKDEMAKIDEDVLNWYDGHFNRELHDAAKREQAAEQELRDSDKAKPAKRPPE